MVGVGVVRRQGEQLVLLHDVLLQVDGQQVEDEDGQELVERVEAAPLEPLWDCYPRVMEPQLLEDEVYPVRLYLLAAPRDEPARGDDGWVG